jgi:hypothetical protein
VERIPVELVATTTGGELSFRSTRVRVLAAVPLVVSYFETGGGELPYCATDDGGHKPFIEHDGST